MTSDYGNEIQEDLNAIVGYDEKFNNAIVRHSLGLKDQAIFDNPNPINVTFHDMKKFDLVNPVVGKLASQVRASKLTDYELTKKILEQGEIDKLQLRLDALKYETNKDDDDNDDGGDDDGTSGTPPPRTSLLRGNISDVSPDNTREENSKIIAQKNQERFQNRQIREREREIKNIPKGIINKRKSSLNFNFPDAPTYTLPRDDFLCSMQPSSSTPVQDDFSQYLQPSPHVLKSQEPRETSFLFSDGTKPESLLPLRNKLKHITPLPSKPTIENFVRPITQMADEKNNTIAIKRPVPKFEETNLSEQLQ